MKEPKPWLNHAGDWRITPLESDPARYVSEFDRLNHFVPVALAWRYQTGAAPGNRNSAVASVEPKRLST